MEFKTYMSIKKRMVNPDENDVCRIECEDCPLSGDNNGMEKECTYVEFYYPEKAEEIVQKWAKEHPVKTYKDDYYSKFPKCMDKSVMPLGCRDLLYGIEHDYYTHCEGKACKVCWNEEYKEL